MIIFIYSEITSTWKYSFFLLLLPTTSSSFDLVSSFADTDDGRNTDSPTISDDVSWVSILTSNVSSSFSSFKISKCEDC